jgi:nucleoside-diphosphate-sugar epimerase
MKGQAYIDVHDIALAHLLAIENEEAGGKRFFITGCPSRKHV